MSTTVPILSQGSVRAIVSTWRIDLTDGLIYSITSRIYDPDDYNGKYAAYLDAWDLVDDALGRVAHRWHQLMLEVGR